MPAKVQPYILRKLLGRNGSTKENIKDGEFQKLQNWYAKNGVLKRRKGISAVSSIANASTLTGTAAVFLPGGTGYKVIVGLSDGIGALSGQEVGDIATSLTITDNTSALWQLKQYKSSMYCLREDIGSLYRSDGNIMAATGISAPTAALTAAEGAAGALAAGAYEIVYTFYNSTTGAESNPSPAATVTIAASKKINYSVIGTSTNGQVNARKIYRSLVGQTDEWFHVVTILDNNTTTYTGDNVELADMGLPAENTNGLPPDGDFFEIHQERLWLTDQVLLYFSEVGLPESFAATSSLNVRSDDGYLIKGLKSFGEVLLVFKQNATYYLAGSDEQSFSLRTLHDKSGCVASHSLAVAEGFCFWFGGDNFYLTDGNRVNAIGNPEVTDLIQGIAAADYDIMQADVYGKDGWYICGIPSGGVITSWVAYNYRTGEWHTMTFDSTLGTPQWIQTLPTSSGEPVLYCNLSASAQKGLLREILDPDATSDLGKNIACSLLTKNYGFEKEDSMKFLKDLQVLVSSTSVAENVTFTLYRDDDATSEATESITTYGGKTWKRVPLSNNGTPGVFMAVGIDYSGDADFDIAGLAFKIVDLGRQVPLAE